jgi:PhzF family phenazine biosynthesis protein
MRIYQVDAFTDRLFSGNPAAVCLPEEDLSDRYMQSMAAEMNLSETAYIRKKQGRDFQENDWSLRWFTPKTEVDLCGHATLASAHVLFEHREAEGDEIRFHTKSGILRARKEEGAIRLDFPAVELEKAELTEILQQALGKEVQAAFRGKEKYLLELKDSESVRSCNPDLNLLAQVADVGFIITAASDDDTFDFVSRFFAPYVGIDEDPVTGSAHCLLAPYWIDKLKKKRLRAYQASERGGVLDLEHINDRVFIWGKAKTVWIGETQD